MLDKSSNIYDESEAMVNLKKSAAQNNSDAIMSLAELSDNPEEAFMYYSKAANLGNSLAQCNIASMYLNGIGTSVDYKEALSRFLIAANDHQENALRNIGDIYYYGLGVPRNVELARNYYSQAIFEGDVLAMEKHDYTSAVNYLERVNNLDKGNGKTIADLADKMYVDDKIKALSFYEKSVGLGFEYVTAFRRLGNYYLKKDKRKAYDFLAKAVALNDPEANCFLGYYYEQESNYGMAVEYYKKAVTLGYNKAYAYLGTLYKNGNGVEKSDEMAVKCWEIAAMADSQLAIKNLIKYYKYKHNQAEVDRWSKRLK